MKYLIVTNHSYMLWQFRRELIEALLEKGEVVISTPFTGHEEDLCALGCRCIETSFERRSVNPLSEMGLLMFYRRLIRKEKPDLVITYSIKPNIYAGLVCRAMKVPYCVNVQGLGTAFQKEYTAKAASLLYKAALAGAHTVFFENSGNAGEFVRRRIIPRGKVTLLHGAGVNLTEYPYQPYPAEKGRVSFLYLGRIMKEKGMDEFFAAAGRLKKEYGEGVHFDLVGFFEDGYRDTVEELVREEIVSFHGFQEDPRPWYAKSHCVVLPSYHEGMSNVLLEAAATGRAVITTDIPGCREAVQASGRKASGLLCRRADTDSLIEAMHSFLEMTEAERIQMGRNGRKRIEHMFDRRDVVSKVLEVIS